MFLETSGFYGSGFTKMLHTSQFFVLHMTAALVHSRNGATCNDCKGNLSHLHGHVSW